MKKLIFPAFALLCSCGNNQDANERTAQTTLETATEISTTAVDSTCFLRTVGPDTFAVKLITHNDLVTGKMMYLYNEKDWRIGKLHGTKKGDEINAVWVYMQEGMIDSIPVMLKLNDNELAQKASVFDPAQGKEILPDTAGYTIYYHKADCEQIPKHDFDFGL